MKLIELCETFWLPVKKVRAMLKYCLDNSLITSTLEDDVSEYKPKEITSRINDLIEKTQQILDNYGVFYSKVRERQFAKHILTAKAYWAMAERAGVSREEFTYQLLHVACQWWWKGKVCSLEQIYNKYPQIMNAHMNVFISPTKLDELCGVS